MPAKIELVRAADPPVLATALPPFLRVFFKSLLFMSEVSTEISAVSTRLSERV